jgi:hypothetical protein
VFTSGSTFYLPLVRGNLFLFARHEFTLSLKCVKFITSLVSYIENMLPLTLTHTQTSVTAGKTSYDKVLCAKVYGHLVLFLRRFGWA